MTHEALDGHFCLQNTPAAVEVLKNRPAEQRERAGAAFLAAHAQTQTEEEEAATYT